MVTLTDTYWQDPDFSSDEDGLPVSRNHGKSADARSPPPPPPPPTESVPPTPVPQRSRTETLSGGR